jgi:hypothetical protein
MPRRPVSGGHAKFPPIGLDYGGNLPHNILMANLLDDIQAFIDTHDLRESQFGVLALNDKNFIPDLRGDGRDKPRRLWPETEAKVRRFMATYRPESAAA